eukprot:CAMPEP_0180139650 /NCGR_PEP_ID=MMETSP0986-20121125/13686_1 /TAXON_ID=697907 /ORGANISM="non described non described, Strain CCMP2293" /LENGTH=187 /DNA_ID=CAMNT_0022081847 /DNA_START=13 /DNA_END=577 /DNA_ORIENTATION=-
MRAVLSLLLCAQAALAFLTPPSSPSAARLPCASCARRALGLRGGGDARGGAAEEDELELLGDAVERTLMGPDGTPVVHVPFLVLSLEEVAEGTRLKDLLQVMSERDCVIPERSPSLSVPLVLMSGLTPVQVSGCVKAIIASGIKGGILGLEATPMCAIAVPKAMDKTMGQLIEELCGDHMANAPGAN